MTNYIIYATTDDELDAKAIANRLLANFRRAYVDRVYDMHLRRDPLAPRTVNRFAVLAEKVTDG